MTADIPAQKLRMALARYENADRECPVRKGGRFIDKCAKCRATKSEGCGLEISGAYQFINEVRALCVEAEA